MLWLWGVANNEDVAVGWEGATDIEEGWQLSRAVTQALSEEMLSTWSSLIDLLMYAHKGSYNLLDKPDDLPKKRRGLNINNDKWVEGIVEYCCCYADHKEEGGGNRWS
jgi:hypothetical protein